MSDRRFGDIEPGELGDTLGELRALMTAIHAELIDVIAAFDEAQGYRVDGMPDTATWLAARANLSLSTARREVAIATRAPAIPALMQAWRQGRLSWDQLQVLAPVATADDGDSPATADGRSSPTTPPAEPSASAANHAASHPGSNTTTSSTGPTTAAPTKTTSSPCAGTITTCSTKANGT